MRRLLIVVALLGMTSCDRSSSPRSCRERAAYNVADAYPNPADLKVAIDTICGDEP